MLCRMYMVTYWIQCMQWKDLNTISVKPMPLMYACARLDTHPKYIIDKQSPQENAACSHSVQMEQLDSIKRECQAKNVVGNPVLRENNELQVSMKKRQCKVQSGPYTELETFLLAPLGSCWKSRKYLHYPTLFHYFLRNGFLCFFCSSLISCILKKLVCACNNKVAIFFAFLPDGCLVSTFSHQENCNIM